MRCKQSSQHNLACWLKQPAMVYSNHRGFSFFLNKKNFPASQDALCFFRFLAFLFYPLPVAWETSMICQLGASQALGRGKKKKAFASDELDVGWGSRSRCCLQAGKPCLEWSIWGEGPGVGVGGRECRGGETVVANGIASSRRSLYLRLHRTLSPSVIFSA